MTATPTTNLYCAPTASGSADGSSFANAMLITDAIASLPQGALANIMPLAGTPASPKIYPPINITYRVNVNITGTNLDGSTGNPLGTVFQGTSAGQNVIIAQDGPTVGLTALTINTVANGCIGVQARQPGTIVDLVDAHFGGFPNGTMIYGLDYAKINFGDEVFVDGSAANFISLSTAKLIGASWINMASGLSFSALLQGTQDAIFDLSGATFVGPGGNVATAGYQWLLQYGARVILPNGYPVPGATPGNPAASGGQAVAP